MIQRTGKSKYFVTRSNSLKIGVITPGFSASDQDWAIPVLQNIVRELAASHEVTVFPLRYPSGREMYSVERARVIPLGGGQRGGIARFPLLLRGLAAFLKEHRRNPFEIVHGFWADEPGFSATLISRLTGIPSIVSVMGGELVDLPALEYGGQRSLTNRYFTRRALRFADYLSCGSKYIESLIRRFEPGCSPFLIPLGVDTERFQPALSSLILRRHTEDRFRLVCVGSLIPVKGHSDLIQAFSLLASDHPSLRLQLIGEGPLLENLKLQVASFGLGNRIDFLGKIDHALLPEYYRAADLYIQASRFESQGMAVLEAAACGLPAVGTAVGILPELGRAALGVPVGEPEQLAAAIATVIGDDQLRTQMAAAAAETIRARFSLSGYIEQLNGVYQEMRSEKPAD